MLTIGTMIETLSKMGFETDDILSARINFKNDGKFIIPNTIKAGYETKNGEHTGKLSVLCQNQTKEEVDLEIEMCNLLNLKVLKGGA